MTSLRYLWQSRISVIFSCQRSRIISTKTGCYLPRPENVYSLVFLFTKVETEWQKCKQKSIEIKAFLLFYHTKEMKKCYFTGATMTIQSLAKSIKIYLERKYSRLFDWGHHLSREGNNLPRYMRKAERINEQTLKKKTCCFKEQLLCFYHWSFKYFLQYVGSNVY